MTDKNKISSIAPLNYQYPSVSKDSIPAGFNKLFPIDYKSEEIEEYEVLFFHRLMKKNYGNPSEIEFEKDSIKKTKDGRSISLGREWKYYIRTHSGGIIQVGTEDIHTRLKTCHVLPSSQKEPSSIIIQEGEKFINALLTEARRQKDQLLNIKKEFESGDERTGLFLLDNVYLTNYQRAELMLDYAEDNEKDVNEEFLRYDPRYPMTPDKQAHHDKFMQAGGMYYDASIFYSFMALEGFVNIIYYAFLKDELRSDFITDQKLDERLDIVTKILLMPSLCDGFKSKQKAAFFKILKKLKNHRNFLFHSKITDSLRTVCFVESGFLYSCKFKKDSNPLFPERKQYPLLEINARAIKVIVEHIVKEILNMMQDEHRALVKSFVLNGMTIPFWRDKNGVIKLGIMKNVE
ncbi:MAG: hypothetical protein Q8P28_02370 [Deltaproteobacteria bacterium]|nr:hypothetical protein [Deltaproteobacteria bacterium]